MLENKDFLPFLQTLLYFADFPRFVNCRENFKVFSRVLEPTFNITLHKWYMRLKFPEIGYFAAYFQYSEVRFS